MQNIRKQVIAQLDTDGFRLYAYINIHGCYSVRMCPGTVTDRL